MQTHKIKQKSYKSMRVFGDTLQCSGGGGLALHARAAGLNLPTIGTAGQW
jgi:hypothetical protein